MHDLSCPHLSAYFLKFPNKFIVNYAVNLENTFMQKKKSHLYLHIAIAMIVAIFSLPSYATTNLHYKFFGLKNEKILANLEKRLTVAAQSTKAAENPKTIADFYAGAPQEIKLALQPFGYFEPQITTELTHSQNEWYMNFNVILGNPIKIKAIDLTIRGEGASTELIQNYLRSFQLTRGKILNTAEYQKYKYGFLDLAINNGFLDAKVKQNLIQIDLKEHSAVIILHLDTGPQYKIGTITFIEDPNINEQNENTENKTTTPKRLALSTKPQEERNKRVLGIHDRHARYSQQNQNLKPNVYSNGFLRRFLPFHKGELYTSAKIEQLKNNLTNSNFFIKSSVEPRISTAQNYPNFVETGLNPVADCYNIPIEINITPPKAKQYEFGIGFGTDTGLRGRAGMERRHLTKNGQFFKTFVSIAQTENNLEMHYLIPGTNPITDQYDVSVGTETQHHIQGNSKIFKTSTGYITTIFGNWQETLRLAVQKEIYNNKNLPSQNSLLLVPSLNFLHTKTDDPIRTTRGHKININIQGTTQKVLADRDFLQLKLDSKLIYPLSSVTSLLLRGSIGYTGISDIYRLPLSFQYFAGGSQSVRGYGYNKLGPGSDLVVISTEIRQRLVPDWYLATFIDAGNAENSFRMHLKQGAGLGVVWLSPVGTIALSVTKAINMPNAPKMIQFSMGPEF